jgi:AraC-like DNA-binding protein
MGGRGEELHKSATVSLLEGAAFEFSSPGRAAFYQEWRDKSVSNHLVTGNYWLYRVIRFNAGSAAYYSRGRSVAISHELAGFFFPPRTLSYGSWAAVSCDISGIWSDAELPPDILQSGPILFRSSDWVLPSNVDHLLDLLRKAREVVSIDRTFRATAVTLKSKKRIDQTFADPGTKIQDVAKSLKVKPSFMTDYFRRDLGLTPVVYRNFLRMETAVFLLAQGKKVYDVCNAVGFSDLSRFNRAALRYLNTVPSQIRGHKQRD